MKRLNIIHWGRGLMAAMMLLSTLALASCEDREKKMDAVESAGQVDYFGKRYFIAKVDRKTESVFIIEPDGVQVPVPLDNVTPVEK